MCCYVYFLYCLWCGYGVVIAFGVARFVVVFALCVSFFCSFVICVCIIFLGVVLL